jgi:hypothetical protein
MDPAGVRFDAALENARRFFVGEADVQKALRKLVEVLDHERIPYAIAGALALNAYGYERVTVDVDVLLTREGLADFKAKYLGRGYSEKFKGSRGVRDTEHGVNVDVLVSGEFPGDGKPKPVAFPDPAVASVQKAGVALLPLEKLVELKLASGMSAAHRLKDLADVLELIRAASLPEELSSRLNPWVRAKYVELWAAAQSAPRED